MFSFSQIMGTTTYDLCAGEIITSSNTESVLAVNDDNALTFYQGDATNLFAYHGTSHGVHFYGENKISMTLSNISTVTFSICEYGETGATWQFTDESGNNIGSVAADADSGNDGEEISFSYTGSSQVITATLSGSQAYLHSLTIENSSGATQLNGYTEVWDFGAEQLDASTYINKLDESTINGWYDNTITAGSTGYNLPDFTVGVLNWVGNSESDRLRSSNTNLIRYDDNVGSSTYTGRIYVNGSASTDRYLSLTLLEDDEVTIIALSQNGKGVLNFVYVADAEAQTDQANLSSDIAEYTFVAKYGGIYRIYDTQDKPSYYRIYRKNADYATVSGEITAPSDIPDGYSIIYTNEAGKKWSASPVSGSYSVGLPKGYSYNISLGNANGYVIKGTSSIDLSSDNMNNITIEAVELYSVSGSISGLSGAEMENLNLEFSTTDSTIFQPEVTLDTENSVYSTELEPDIIYSISAKGVNDYELQNETITITGETIKNLEFVAKPTYKVTLTASDLSEEQLSVLEITFTNLNAEDYSYRFSSIDNIELRDGIYSVKTSGLDSLAVEQALTSNLEINGDAVSKNIPFDKVTDWTFTDDYITNATAYKGLLFSGSVNVRGGSGNDLNVGAGAEIKIPVTAGDKVLISHYYAANFTINGDTTIENTSGSTSNIETTEYTNDGTADTVTLVINSTSYFTEIKTTEVTDYEPVVYVGENREFHTIGDALNAVAKMKRIDNNRVSIMIDPGNYDEMLVIKLDSISLVNASDSPSIALKNKGVDIDDNAVRITSYYGHGYNYYSMGNDQKWDAEVLAVNKANGYLSYENAGSGTTNGSYWNATVVVQADGFEAENIIFENSFNQYISQKESADVVEEWSSGGKGTRPTNEENTDVQDKDYVERAAALAIASGDKIILNNCRIVGHQDSFYGTSDSRVAIYKGVVMGSTDYIFGAMNATFYKSQLELTTSYNSNDVAYITAAQQSAGRGYLMYECTITSAEPGVDMATIYRSKPGYFGRPWSAETSEVVFFNTIIETSDYPGNEGESLIMEEGWNSSLSGQSSKMYEYGTIEKSAVDNSSKRVSWATMLTEALLNDGTEITTYNFTKGDDGWDPFPELIVDDEENDDPPTAVEPSVTSEAEPKIYAHGDEIYINNINSGSIIKIYSIQGILVKQAEIQSDVSFTMRHPGCWIVCVQSRNINKSAKVVTN